MSWRWIIPIVCLMLAACSGGNSGKEGGMEQGEMKKEWPRIASDSARIISLPTPMQIPALLRNTKAHYNKEMLMPVINEQKSFFKSNVLLGMYMIDLAYAASYSDNQASIEYFHKCRELGDEMGIGTEINEEFVARFERNLNRPDSLGRIIMEMYESGHAYFEQNEKEGIGLIMIMGCLFEGLNMGFEQAREHDLMLFLHILSQHKQYTANLVYALEGYEIPAEIKEEHLMLERVNGLFKQLNPPSAYQVKHGMASETDINAEVLRQIETICKEFRNAAMI